MPQAKKKSFIQKNGLISVWAMAGFIATGYIGFLLTGAGTQHPGVSILANKTEVDTSGPVASNEVAVLRAHVKELREREAQLAQKLNKLEQSFGPTSTASIDNEQTASKDRSGYGIDDEPETTIVEAIADAKTPVSVKVLPLSEDDEVSAIFSVSETESYGLNLASARTIDSLERHWDYLSKTNGKLLSGLQPRYIRRGDDESVLFTLVAGPFQRLSDAKSRCVDFVRIGVDCTETRYNGKTEIPFQAARSDKAPSKLK